MKRTVSLGVASLALVAAMSAALLDQRVAAQARGGAQTSTPARGAAAPAAAAASAPRYVVNPYWPPGIANSGNHWVLGAVSGVAVDSRDHIWIVHRGAPTLEGNEKGMMSTPPSSSVCCVAAPAVLEFDQAGHITSSWGGPELGFPWPQMTGGIAVDGKGNVWVAAYGLDPAPAGRGRGAAANPDDAAAAPARGRAAAPPAGGAAPAAGGAAGGGAAAGGRGARGGAAPAAGGAPAAGARGGAPAAAADQAPAAPARGRGAAPAGPPALADAHVTKYSRSGTFLLQIGKPGDVGTPTSQTALNRPAGMAVDDAANEVFIADSGNHRIVVFDATTGAYKRMWGAYGEAPTAAGGGPYDPNSPPSRQFRDPTCVKIAKDGMVYVCDRTSDRIQVFQKDGKFVKEMVVSKTTRGGTASVGDLALNASGSVWDVAFSNDAGQRFLYVADGVDQKIWILRRDTLETVGSFGDGGRQSGRFVAVGSVAVDSHGNIFTGEQHHAKRVQKFAPAAAAPAAPPAGR